jgi:hypothetical protein
MRARAEREAHAAIPWGAPALPSDDATSDQKRGFLERYYRWFRSKLEAANRASAFI